MLLDFVLSEGLSKGEGAKNEIEHHQNSQSDVQSNSNIQRALRVAEFFDSCSIIIVIAIVADGLIDVAFGQLACGDHNHQGQTLCKDRQALMLVKKNDVKRFVDYLP